MYKSRNLEVYFKIFGKSNQDLKKLIDTLLIFVFKTDL